MQQSFQTIKQLVTDFKAQEVAYLSPSYQEPQVRQDFIDKFFTALGWDVTHERQKNPYEQEVHIENRVRMPGSSQRRADYAFFLSPNFRDPKFFVEAKKPSRNLANADDYYQAIRYGWNAKTPLVVLTDFEEFHILDCRFKPNINEALSRKVESFRYSDYAVEDKFAQMYYLFSREAVAGGSIEKRAAELPRPRGKAGGKGLFKGGYQAVDEAFLEELDEYRITLAKAFKKANEKLEGEELTEAVQRTIDRLVFIRFLEDKGIEEKAIVGLKGQKSAWRAFVSLCKRYEPKYNGLVFKSHHILDNNVFEPSEDKLFAEICGELADPASPYDFNQIPISILGSIYERFLGKVVHATDKRVKVQEKPEVRKAGGVYYTPEYIVRYIVKETVGRLIDGKTPAEIAQLAFADIACGSGSFLIEVYAQLLDYHVRYYQANPQKAKADDVFERDGKLQLTLKKKKEILLNNIYGVDIDFQATEVTQLSLYLKMLEDATMMDAHQFGLFKETILPDLKQNIVCGNSLIGRDIADGSLFADVDDIKLKPMNFEEVFPKVMKRGGFDAVVGNPPYIRIQTLTETTPAAVKYFSTHFSSAGSGNYDIYVVFVERALNMLNKLGKLGYILPHKFFNAQYGAGLRRVIADGRYLSHVVHFGDQQVFDGASTYTCLMFLDKGGDEAVDVVKVSDLEEWRSNGVSIRGTIPAAALMTSEWNFAVGQGGSLLQKLNLVPTKLEHVTSRIFQGIKTSADKIYIIEEVGHKGKVVKVFSPQTQTEFWMEPDLLHPLIKGGDSRRYRMEKTNRLILFPYARSGNGPAELIPEEIFKKSYPLTWKYLIENKDYLQNREEGKMKGPKWYAYGRSQALDVMPLPKIFTPDIALQSSFSLDTTGECFFTGGVAGGYGILVTEQYNREYVLGLLNSKVLNWMVKQTATQMRGGYYSFESRFIRGLPIKTLDCSNPDEKAKHDHIVGLVGQMLQSKEKLSASKTDAEKNRLELQCESLDRQIDEAVYELYALTEEEIKIVEGK